MNGIMDNEYSKLGKTFHNFQFRVTTFGMDLRYLLNDSRCTKLAPWSLVSVTHILGQDHQERQAEFPYSNVIEEFDLSLFDQ